MESWVTSLNEQIVLQHLSVGTLVAARVAPLTVVTPWLALRSAPASVRLSVVVALTVALTPLAFGAASIPAPGWVLVPFAMREVVLGTAFGIAVSLPLFALQWAGAWVDQWRGAAFMGIPSSTTGQATGPLAEFKLLWGLGLFVVLGGHRLVFAAFVDGLRIAPVGSFLAAPDAWTVALGAARLAGHALALAAAVAAPAAVSLILVELALGVIARAAPQIPVFFAGMPLRAAVGLGAVLVGLGWVAARWPAVFREAIRAAAELVRNLAP